MGGISHVRRRIRAAALARRQAERAQGRRIHKYCARCLEIADLSPPEARVFHALAKAPKTLQEIERWGRFAGGCERRRQQTVCRCLHRLIDRGLVEKTSRRRSDGRQGVQCCVWRLTTMGELWAMSG